MQVPCPLSQHAHRRTTARRLSTRAIEAALTWGRRYWSHGDQVFRLDRRCVRRAASEGIRLDCFEGVTVVVAPTGTIVTVWRNRSPRRIRR